MGKDVWLRVNADFGSGHHDHVITGGPSSKFGIWKFDIPIAKKIAQKFGLKIKGLHQHIGSNVQKGEVFLKGVRIIASLASSFPDIEEVNIGGGALVCLKARGKVLGYFEVGRGFNENVSGLVAPA